ncbi:MAG TPA: sugar phosphate isomerase/epimerase [Methanocella sp.]|uniref:sugar phosphate isomerase/epimerase family protein n=1 Tax=Methanocella sp. TaxID=2052833 RepID=UPI002B610105|nr:sugar phosphate isomerase/epimerase [Methanocella sp.]HTY91472.1 sugar phosphate isomerase/epimerase [Methanocella sp.]
MPEVLLQVRLPNLKKADEIFEIAERSGYDGIELDCAGLDCSLDDLYVKSVDYNLPIKSLLAPTLTFSQPVHYLLHGDTDVHSAFHAFKPQRIVFRLPGTPVLKDLAGYVFKDRLNYFKGLYGNDAICVENGAPSGSLRVPPIFDIKGVRNLAYELDIFINFDVANCAASGRDILQAYDMLAPRVKSAHISDHGGRDSSHLVPGDGLLPLGTLLTKMKANRYNGSFTMELDQQEIAGRDSGEIMILYKELIGYVKSHF